MSVDPVAARAALEAARAALQGQTDDSAGSRRPVELDQSSVGRLSRIDAMQMQAMALASQRRREVELVRIEAALARIADGSYGECVSCGEAIAPSRLALDPAIATCIGCASGRN